MDYEPTPRRIPPLGGERRINVGMPERLASAAGGALFAYLGLKRHSVGGILLAAAGGGLLFRGITGYCPVNAAAGRNTAVPATHPDGVVLSTRLTVNQPRADVYAFWRELENLPRFMRHLDDVKQIDAERSHWAARSPRDLTVIEWDAEIVADEANERLAWRSLPGADVDHAGEVVFKDAPAGHGTEVHVHLTYRPPAGDAGRAAAKLLNPVFEQLVKEDVRRFKNLIETGEVPSTDGQPSGRS